MLLHSISPIGINFQSKAKAASMAKKVVPAAVAAAGTVLAAGKSQGDVFVKESPMSDEDKIMNYNLRLVHADKTTLERYELKYNIKGKTYAEKRRSAEVRYKDSEILIKENKRNLAQWFDEDLKESIKQSLRDKDRIEDYMSLLDSVSSERLTKEEATEKAHNIANYKKLHREMLKIKSQGMEDSYEYEDLNRKSDDIATDYIARYAVDPDVYINC